MEDQIKPVPGGAEAQLLLSQLQQLSTKSQFLESSLRRAIQAVDFSRGFMDRMAGTCTALADLEEVDDGPLVKEVRKAAVNEFRAAAMRFLRSAEERQCAEYELQTANAEMAGIRAQLKEMGAK